ncbi:MAG: PilZ domain-containing protein [Pseudomonadota bacterium]
MNTERRRFTRIPFKGMAHLQRSSGAQSVPVQVLDVSFKGALVEVSEAADVVMGDTGTLILQLGQGEECIAMLVEVAHVAGLQAGLQCRGIDLDSVTHLRRLLAVNSGDPALLERDLKALLTPP